MDLARARREMERIGYPADEAAHLERLMGLLAGLPPPPDPLGVLDGYAARLDRFRAQLSGQGEGEALEESFLDLYAHLHGHEAPYTPDERQRMDEAGGYWNHAGGLSPVLKAPRYLGPDSSSADFGAGNGLQCLLMQVLRPHRLSVQFEISSRAIVAGQALQAWLGVPRERVRWVAGDVHDAPTAGLDFIYLYRPVRPEGQGVDFYRRFARELAGAGRAVTIFSIADCLRPFLPTEFEVFYSDGHLTCYRCGDQTSQPSR